MRKEGTANVKRVNRMTRLISRKIPLAVIPAAFLPKAAFLSLNIGTPEFTAMPTREL